MRTRVRGGAEQGRGRGAGQNRGGAEQNRGGAEQGRGRTGAGQNRGGAQGRGRTGAGQNRGGAEQGRGRTVRLLSGALLGRFFFGLGVWSQPLSASALLMRSLMPLIYIRCAGRHPK